MQYFSQSFGAFLVPIISLGAAVSVVGAGNPAAQAVRVHPGDLTNGFLGSAVSAAGDVNGDGFRDYIMGMPGQNKALIYSGITGALLREINGEQGADAFGASVASAGDINGDGLDDVIIGDPDLFVGCMPQGGAMVYSGLDGSLLLFPAGITGWERFGHSVAGAGDVDGDGLDDIIIGAPERDPACAALSGGINIFSGYNGGPIFDTVGGAGWRLGSSVVGMGDVNGDGFADVAASAPGVGKVLIIDAHNSTTLRTLTGPVLGKFGAAIANIGDINGDGVNDIAIGASYLGISLVPGKVFIYSGLNGSILDVWIGQSAGDGFGFSVAGAGDVNGDGVNDVAVGSPWAHSDSQSTGRVEIRSGQTGQIIKIVSSSANFTSYGASVAGLGDLDGDGLSDILVGAPQAGTSKQGSAFLYGGNQNVVGLEPGDTLLPSNAADFIASGDLNGDGFADIVTVNTLADQISIFVTGADGAFLPSVDKPAGDGPNSVAIGDYDDDGDQDLAVLAAKDKNIVLFRNNGAGIMTKKGVLKTGKKPVSIQAADLTCDGRDDLVLAYQSEDKIAVFATKATGSIEKRFAKPKIISVGDLPAQVLIARVNADPVPDLLVVNRTAQTISVLLNNGNGTFTTKPAIATNGQPLQAIAADFNHNGITDLGWLNAGGQFTWLTGNNHGLFQTGNGVLLDPSTKAVVAADLDFDGVADLVSARDIDASMSMLFNNQAGQFSGEVLMPAAASPKSMVTSDLDGDGDADLITADAATNSVVIHRNLWLN